MVLRWDGHAGGSRNGARRDAHCVDRDFSILQLGGGVVASPMMIVVDGYIGLGVKKRYLNGLLLGLGPLRLLLGLVVLESGW